ncbi:DUF7660 family protein [Nocardioides jejuensis]|uniref:DUF7660 domain-containing protein n=1 Tax=Nocardioides jejuensis TaxID=2502782 RepID=A0A4V2NXV7_9ACTN|nr:hypothetical protein [Nocardioides jejuensis]TCJ22722.1 hypothetical protein EPD65_12290 [Nocardioides jejuensis]
MAAHHGSGRPTGEVPSGIATRDDLGEFILRVLDDLRGGGSAEWENNTLERFLDGMSAFTLARVVERAGQDEPSWQLFAEIIAAATGYE